MTMVLVEPTPAPGVEGSAQAASPNPAATISDATAAVASARSDRRRRVLRPVSFENLLNLFIGSHSFHESVLTVPIGDNARGTAVTEV